MLPSELPEEVERALAPLMPVLTAAGLSPVKWVYSEQSFGNFAVDFIRLDRVITLTRDRGQFMLSGDDRKSMEAAGLWRAFDSAEDMLPHLSKWFGL